MLCVACVAQDGNDAIEENRDYAAISRALAEELSLHGYDASRPECKLEVLLRRADSRRMTDVVVVSSPRLEEAQVPGLDKPVSGPLFSFTLDAKDGRILEISNCYLLKVVMARTDEESAEPELTEQEVKERCEALLARIRPDLNMAEMRLSSCRYNPDMHTMGRTWRVSFERTWQGYAMQDDFVNISLDDRYGLRSFTTHLYSKPAEPVLKVQAKDAEAAAREKVEGILRKDGYALKGMLLSVQLDRTNTVYDNPCRYLHKSAAGKRFRQQDAVLVHRIVYHVTAYENAALREPSWRVAVIVLVSAETGRFLCGETGF